MKTQERAIRELILANPIREDAEFELVEMVPGDYLAEMEQVHQEASHLRPVGPPQDWSRQGLVAVAAFATVLLIGAAILLTNPTPLRPTLASDDALVGVWDFPFQKTATEIEFLSNGTYTTLKYGEILDSGTYDLAEGLLKLHSDGECASPGSVRAVYPPDGSYTVVMEGPDSAAFSLVEDQCPRYRDLDEATLKRTKR